MLLDDDGWAEQFVGFEHTAFRFEQQPAYNVTYEADQLARFLAGDPQPPTEVPSFVAWHDQIARQVAEGKRIERVRVHDDPPTPYQRWVRWVGLWNIEAGEVMRYLTRSQAHEVGLLPAAGDEDWWLFDSSRLVVMRFDDEHRLVERELVTDPERLVQAGAWRDLGVHHSVPDDVRGRADVGP